MGERESEVRGTRGSVGKSCAASAAASCVAVGLAAERGGSSGSVCAATGGACSSMGKAGA